MGNGTINEPEVTITIEPASALASNATQKVLLVGQMLAAGTATSGVLISNFPTDNSQNTLFGARSMLTNMIKAFKVVNPNSIVDILPIQDAAGTAATGVVSFTGTATEDGEIIVEIGSGATGLFTLTVASGATATVIGAALVTLITANTNLPMTAANAAGVVTLTMANLGTVGNTVGIRVTGEVAGITRAITATSGGATDPTSTGIFSVVDGERYQTVIYPDEFTLSDLTSFLDPRFNTDNDILDGVGIISKTDTRANLVTLAAALNSQSLVIMGNQPVTDTLYQGSAMFEMDDVQSAIVGGLRSIRLTEGVNIASILTGSGGLDNTGGPALSSRPYFNTPASNLTLIPIGKGFGVTDQGLLETAGVSLVGNNKARNTVILGTMVTTYKTDSAGNSDLSFKFLNFVDTASNVREFFFNNYKKEYAQSRLTTGDLIEGRPMANEGSVRAFSNQLYTQLSGKDFALTQAGEAALKTFKAGTTVSINTLTGLVTIIFNSVPLVTQLREIIATMKISFSTT